MYWVSDAGVDVSSSAEKKSERRTKAFAWTCTPNMTSDYLGARLRTAGSEAFVTSVQWSAA